MATTRTQFTATAMAMVILAMLSGEIIIPTCHAFSTFSIATPISKNANTPPSQPRLIRGRGVNNHFMAASENTDNGMDEISRLRESASRLRKEVEELDAAAEQGRQQRKQSASATDGSSRGGAEAVQYFELDDSCWEIT